MLWILRRFEDGSYFCSRSASSTPLVSEGLEGGHRHPLQTFLIGCFVGGEKAKLARKKDRAPQPIGLRKLNQEKFRDFYYDNLYRAA